MAATVLPSLSKHAKSPFRLLTKKLQQAAATETYPLIGVAADQMPPTAHTELEDPRSSRAYLPYACIHKYSIYFGKKIQYMYSRQKQDVTESIEKLATTTATGCHSRGEGVRADDV